MWPKFELKEENTKLQIALKKVPLEPLFLNNRLNNFHKIVTILRDFPEEN